MSDFIFVAPDHEVLQKYEVSFKAFAQQNIVLPQNHDADFLWNFSNNIDKLV
jgi:hypothetical protein